MLVVFKCVQEIKCAAGKLLTHLLNGILNINVVFVSVRVCSICSWSKDENNNMVLNCFKNWCSKHNRAYTYLNSLTFQGDTHSTSSKTAEKRGLNLQMYVSASACIPNGFHTWVPHMLHISWWITRLQEFTPVEWVVIMHVAKCFSPLY